MPLAFDLDECLVSTRSAHVAAFQKAGYDPIGENKYVPSSMWHKPPTPEQYEKKHEYFPEFLRSLGTLLPASRILAAAPRSVILTGTSARSLRAVLDVFPSLCGGHTFMTGMTPIMKIAWLRAHESSVYFDDWTHFVERVRKETTWTSVDVSGW